MSEDSSERVFHRASRYEAMFLLALGAILGVFYGGVLMNPLLAGLTFVFAALFAIVMMYRRWGLEALV